MANYEKKFEEMDKFIEGFDDEKYEFFSKEAINFSLLNEYEKVKAYNQLFTKAILNKKSFLRRTKIQMESYIDMLDIIQNAIKYNASSDVILNIVKEFKSRMEDDLNSTKEKMRYCKK